MNTIYFVSESVLKANSPVNFNVDQSLLNLAIIDAQEMRVQMALGSNLYNKLITLVDTGDISVITYANYKTLLDNYVVPAVIYWSIVECLSYVRYKIMNKGVQSQNSDNSTPLDLEEIKYFQDSIRNKAEFKSQRLIDYLIENSTLFTEYTQSLDADDIAPVGSSYFSGMVLDDDLNCEKYLGINKNIRFI